MIRQFRAVALCIAVAVALVLSCAFGATAADLDLDVNLEPATRSISAVAEFAARAADYSFTLHRALEVRRATSDGQRLALSSQLSRDRRTWRIATKRGARIRIEYGGVLPELDTRLDHRGILQHMPPMMSERGSFLPAGTDWYPAPSDLFSYSVRLSVPSDQRALVPGTLTSETLPQSSADRYIARFEFAHPTNGIDLMAGPYVINEKLIARDRGQPLRFRTYFYSDLAPLGEGYLEDSARYVDLY